MHLVYCYFKVILSGTRMTFCLLLFLRLFEDTFSLLLF